MRSASFHRATALAALLALVLSVLASSPVRAQQTVPLQLNRLQSFQATTPGYTDRYMRHYNDLGETAVVNVGSETTLKQDATFRVVAGLGKSDCYSFESRNYPRHYLRHSNYRIRKDQRDNSVQFDLDATFCARGGLGGPGVSFESANIPGRYIRHYNNGLWLADSSGTNPWDNPNSFAADATWTVVPAWWKSGVDLPAGELHSFQVTTLGYTDRYLRHDNSLGRTDVVTVSSSGSLKQDATFRIVAGLADTSCYSFESRGNPGHYLRHSNGRIRKDPRDGSVPFDLDATFCAQRGLYWVGVSGDGVSLESLNQPGRYIRHYNNEVWLANSSGANFWDSPNNFAADATWTVESPWAP